MRSMLPLEAKRRVFLPVDSCAAAYVVRGVVAFRYFVEWLQSTIEVVSVALGPLELVPFRPGISGRAVAPLARPLARSLSSLPRSST